MAFPGDYTKYQEVTISSAQVAADLTDYPIYISLADLSKAGADIFDTCRSDGGDIRVTKSDGTTELPREVVFIDTTAKTGELHVKYSGTLSGSSDTTIRIWYNGVDTEPAASSTYGSENVWSDYEIVHHMQQDPSGSSPQMLDSTANNQDGVTAGSMTSGDSVDGKLAGKAIDFDGVDDDMTIADSVLLGNIFDSYTTVWTLQAWYKPNVSNQGFKGGKFPFPGWVFGGLSSTNESVHARQNAAQEDRITGSGTIGTSGTWYMAHYTNTNSYTATDFKLYTNGSLGTTSTSDDGLTEVGNISNSQSFKLGSDSDAKRSQVVDEFRIRLSDLGTNWISTEYTNHNSPATFYSTSDEISGGGGGGVNANFFAFM